MRLYQERVITEKKELDAKRTKLEEFQKTDRFDGLPHEEQHLLRTQETAMTKYSEILGKRIKFFG